MHKFNSYSILNGDATYPREDVNIIQHSLQYEQYFFRCLHLIIN